MKFKQYLQEAESGINRAAVEKAAMKKAMQAFGDKTDKTKVKGMVDKAIKLGQDTEDAVAIVLGFFSEEYDDESVNENMFANALKKLTGDKEPKEMAKAMKDKKLIKLVKAIDSGSSQGAAIRDITMHIRMNYNDLEMSDIMAYMLPVVRGEK